MKESTKAVGYILTSILGTTIGLGFAFSFMKPIHAMTPTAGPRMLEPQTVLRDTVCIKYGNDNKGVLYYVGYDSKDRPFVSTPVMDPGLSIPHAKRC